MAAEASRPLVGVGRDARSVWTRRALAVGLVLVVGAVYLGGALCQGELGYPLDDGWIHQTYARNLAQSGRLSYVGDQVSAGSTSPLWTALLSIAYLVGLPPRLWSYALGASFLALTGWASMALAARLYPQQRRLAAWVGAACLLEWHLAWASFSGMETTLFTSLSLLVMERYVARARPVLVGLLGGLLVLTRPEGLVLVVLVGAAVAVDALWIERREGKERWHALGRRLGGMAGGVAVTLVPYAALNWATSGRLLPNTYYAKQVEYAVLLAQPLLTRLWRVARRPLVGGQVLLLPGFVWAAASGLREGWQRQGVDRRTVLNRWLPLAWWAAYLGIYALRMPVDYQYGRYVMPTIPMLILYGIVGTASWLRLRSRRMVERAVSRALVAAIMCLFVAFLVIGQQAYVGDVRLIQCEMVRVARWIEGETPPGAMVAAHDIGAIGYYGGRQLIDLAGLVTPEVVPVMRDEERLAAFIVDAGVDYLVTFPSWYPWMTAQERFARVYDTGCAWTVERGGDNMAVYEVQRE